jgi:hypothetical protein
MRVASGPPESERGNGSRTSSYVKAEAPGAAIFAIEQGSARSVERCSGLSATLASRAAGNLVGPQFG